MLAHISRLLKLGAECSVTSHSVALTTQLGQGTLHGKMMEHKERLMGSRMKGNAL